MKLEKLLVNKIGVLSVLGSPLLGYTIDSLIKQGVTINAVILDAKGSNDKDLRIWNERTGGNLSEIQLEKFAVNGIPFYFVANHNSIESNKLIKKLELDLLINGGTPRILKEKTLQAPKVGVLNIHPGNLPSYRGCTCVEWAIYNDEQISNTVHFMTPIIDDGPILASECYVFLKKHNYTDIRVHVYKHGFLLLARVVKQLRDIGDIKLKYQTSGGNYYKPISEVLLAEVKLKLISGNYAFQE